MQEYLILGMIFVFFSIGLILFLAGSYAVIPQEAWITKQSAIILILLALTSTFLGILGGYFIGVYIGIRRTKRESKQKEKRE